MPLQYYTEGNIALHNYRAIYFYIPKVACSSIKSVCFDLLNPGETISNVHHYDYPCIRKNEVEEYYSNYFKFAFVRNPWDRLVSCYRNKIKHDKNYNDSEFRNGVFFKLVAYNMFWGGMSFDEFVDAICKIPDEYANPHFRSQHTFISDGNGNTLTDYIGKFEQLDSDFAHVCTEIGASCAGLPHLMIGGNNVDYKNFYTNKTRAQVTARYAKDITLFDYDY